MKNIAILVTGARNWTDYELIYNTLQEYQKYKSVIIIEGECIGVDKLAKKAGQELQYNIESYPAEWNKFGLSAGPIRNKQMVNRLLEHNETKEICVIAFHDDLQNSKGTKNCVNYAKKNNVQIRYVSH